MKPDHLHRLEALRDSLLERALADADPANWIAGEKIPSEMTRDERGDAKWCRILAVNTVALTMQVARLLQNLSVGGAVGREPNDDEISAENEIERYERAAVEVLSRAAKR